MERKERFLQKTPVVWMGAFICCLLWGSAFPCIKLGYAWMDIAADDTAAQILYAGCRFTLAGILTILIGSVLQGKFLHPIREDIKKVIWLSFLQTVLQYLFFYIGLAHTTGVKASIIEGVNVFVAVFVAGFLFQQEKVTTKKLLGCVIGFIGVVIVNIVGGNFEDGFVIVHLFSGSSQDGGLGLSLAGEGFIFISTIAYAFSSVFMKKYSKEHNPVMLSGYQFLVGGIIMVVCGLIFGGRLDAFSGAAVGMLLWLAFVSAMAYSLWGILLKYNPVSKVAVFGFMNPVFGVILSAILLRESQSVGVSAIVALVLVCIGIYIVNKPEKA